MGDDYKQTVTKTVPAILVHGNRNDDKFRFINVIKKRMMKGETIV